MRHQFKLLLLHCDISDAGSENANKDLKYYQKLIQFYWKV